MGREQVVQRCDRLAPWDVSGHLEPLRVLIEHRVNAVGLDWTVELGFARDQVQARRPVQGNLDPLALLTGGAPLDRSIDSILEALAGGPFIFNLGHGILPEPPIAHVERLIARVRKGAA